MAVMIGVDPHKRSHTAVAIDGDVSPRNCGGRILAQPPPAAVRAGAWKEGVSPSAAPVA
jgi:hypothetical protein